MKFEILYVYCPNYLHTNAPWEVGKYFRFPELFPELYKYGDYGTYEFVSRSAVHSPEA
jgi:hypothetical protein